MRDISTLRIQKDDTSTHFDSLESYSATLEALVPFFEYSPRIDTQDFDLASSETQERMKRLNEGLDTIEEALPGKQESEPINELLGVVSRARSAREALLASSDVDTFIATMESLQEEAKETIISLYSQSIPQLRQSLNEMNRSIQKTLR